jgi:hypothetical protein
MGRLLQNFWPGLCTIIRGLLRWLHRPPPHGVRHGRCCIDVPPDAYKRADPLIYAQYYLMKMGLSVTWDNPDIQLFDHGVPVPPSTKLAPDHAYQVQVRVWNGSYDAPAAGVGVQLSYLSFGVATTTHPIATRVISLGVKGSPHCPSFAAFRWRTPAIAGHYCLQARLDWADDANPDNNLGQKNVDVGVAHSPARFTFRLRNAASVRRGFVLEADAYQLPALRPCDDRPPPRAPTRIAESRARWQVALREQGRGTSPVPADWTVRIVPRELTLAPDEERTIQVAIEPRDPAFIGTRSFNIHAFVIGNGNDHQLAGGVTLQVTRS